MAASILGAVASTVIGGMLADDHGAEAANDAAADATSTQARIAKEQWDRYKTVYQPLEDAMVAGAQNADSPEAYEKAASEASATVASQYGKARDRLQRTPGLDPSSGAYQASMVGLDMAQAASDVTQQNTARQRVKDNAYAKQVDALSLGKGLPASASAGLATVASQSASQAQAGMAQAQQQAQAIGGLTDRVFSSPTVSNWLGNAGGGSGGGVDYSLGSVGSGLGLKAPASALDTRYSSNANYALM